MRFSIKGNLLRKAVLWTAPLGLLSGTALHAQWAPQYGYYDNYDHAMRHHQRDEKRDLKQHQREERWYYGDSWALRQHQREERHELKHHQQHERGYDDFNRSYGRNGYYEGGWYEGRRY
jgi:hypothetical protein